MSSGRLFSNPVQGPEVPVKKLGGLQKLVDAGQDGDLPAFLPVEIAGKADFSFRGGLPAAGFEPGRAVVKHLFGQKRCLLQFRQQAASDVLLDTIRQIGIDAFPQGAESRQKEGDGPFLADGPPFSDLVETRQEPAQGELGNLHTEVLGGDVFHVVGFIENQFGVGGQDGGVMVAPGGSAHGQIGEEQMVVHHQKVGRGRLAPCLVEKTAAVEFALDPGAGITLAGDFVPQVGRDIKRKIRAAAVRGLPSPLGDNAVKSAPFLLQKQLALLIQSLQLVQAEIVAPSLDQHCIEFTIQHLLQQRNIFVDQLFLQIDSVGGNHHPLLVADGPENCRNQVGQALAGAGSSLDEGHL